MPIVIYMEKTLVNKESSNPQKAFWMAAVILVKGTSAGPFAKNPALSFLKDSSILRGQILVMLT
jgi:hypothetical protein